MTNDIQVVDSWFSPDEPRSLLGNRCNECGTYQFPPTGSWCPNPSCQSEDVTTVPLSRTGTVWSYTDAQYAPPPPYLTRSDPYEPFAIAAVELEREKMIVLGQVAEGFGIGDLHVGAAVEVVIERLDGDETTSRFVWRWRPVGEADSEGAQL